jgi:hypothetical protein
MPTKKSKPKERTENPSSDGGKEIKKPFHKIANNGWVQNVVSSLIIVPIFGAIGIGIWHFFAPKKAPLTDPPLAIGTGFPDETKASESGPPEMPGPRQITDQISNAEPYQQDAIAKSFENTPVDWKLYLKSIKRSSFTEEKNLLLIDLENVEELSPDERVVRLWVPIIGNERLSLLKKNAFVRVKGFIKSADSITIDLKDGATIEPIDTK